MAADVKGRAVAPPDGTLIQGRAPAPVVPDVQRLRARPSHVFVFLAHPAMWDVAIVGGAPVPVPRLRRLDFEPGVSGVVARKDQFDGDAKFALVQLAEKGWTPIPRSGSFTAFGRVHSDYVHVFDGVRGPVHLDIWHQPYVRGGTVVYDFDEEGWLDWLAGLVPSGLVHAPDRMALKALEIDLRKQMQKCTSSAARSAAAGEAAELFELKLGAEAFKVVPGGKSTKSPPKPKPAPAPEE